MIINNIQNEQNYNYKIPFYCPYCLEIPELYWLADFRKTIFFRCSCCSFSKMIHVDNYFSYLKRFNQDNPYCGNHKGNKEGSEYCLLCDKWLCLECAKVHFMKYKNNHRTITKNFKIESNIKCNNCNKQKSLYCKKCKKHICSTKCYPEHQSQHKSFEMEGNKTVNLDTIQKTISSVESTFEENIHSKITMYINKVQKEISTLETAYKEFRETQLTLLKFIKTLWSSAAAFPFNINSIRNISIGSIVDQNDIWHSPSIYHYYLFIEGLKTQNVFVTLKLDDINLMGCSADEMVPCPEGIIHICYINENTFAACNSDSTIKIYDNDFKCLDILTGHKGAVSYLTLLDDGKLLSSSDDKTLKVWSKNKKSYQNKITIKGHSDSILKVIQLSKDRIASCSSDTSIKIWNKSSNYSLITTLKGHVGPVSSIIQLKNKELLVSGSGKDDRTLRLWDLTKYKCLKFVQNVHCCFANALIEVNNSIVVGSLGIINIVNSKNLQIITRIFLEREFFCNCFIPLNKNILIIGTSIGSIHGMIISPSPTIVFVYDDSMKGNIYSFLKTKDSYFICSSLQGLKKLYLKG